MVTQGLSSTALPFSSRHNRTENHPTMQQFTAELLAGRGEVSPVSLTDFAAVLRAGNAAQQGRKDSAGQKRKAPLSERKMQTNAPSSGDLLSERLALAGLSLDGDPGKSEEDEDQYYSSEPGVHTARAVTVQRLCGVGGLPRRQGNSRLLPPRGSLDHMDRHTDEAERQWGRAPAAAVEVQVSEVGMRMLTENRRTTSVFDDKAPSEDKSHGTPVEGVAVKEEEEEEDEVIIGVARDLTHTDHDATSTTVSNDWGYIDDNKSLFFTTSAAQKRARANAIFIPALSRGILVGGGQPEVGDLSYAGSASSLSLVPTVFDVRIPTPPPRMTAGLADDSILPSRAQRHVGWHAGGGGRGLSNDTPSSLRRGRGRPGPGSNRHELGGAVPACGEVAGTPVPAGVLPGENVRQPSAENEAGTVGYDEWSSASEMGFRYGECPGAPASRDNWKARWMRYEGDYR